MEIIRFYIVNFCNFKIINDKNSRLFYNINKKIIILKNGEQKISLSLNRLLINDFNKSYFSHSNIFSIPNLSGIASTLTPAGKFLVVALKKYFLSASFNSI